MKKIASVVPLKRNMCVYLIFLLKDLRAFIVEKSLTFKQRKKKEKYGEFF